MDALGTSMKREQVNKLWDFWGPIAMTLALYTGIRLYVAEARYIPSGSMLPGLQLKDRLIIEKLTYKRRPPRRGEIVVFNSPYSFDNKLNKAGKRSPLKCGLLNFPLIASINGLSDPSCDAYIKRVVAIGGDKVRITNRGQVFLNDTLITESYVSDFCNLDALGRSSCPPLRGNVPKGHVLVLGDNRNNSWDGRFWPGGAFLSEEEIIGRAFWRFWPISRFSSLSL